MKHNLDALNATARVEYALANFQGKAVLSSSFGAQSAVSLHLITQVQPDIPVIVIDTGYLFPETYAFIDELTERLELNLHVYEPAVSAAWREARHGRQWERGLAGITEYNRIAKVEPMRRALDELNAGIWFAGLRRSQSASRAQTPFVQRANKRYKIHPIADWSDRDIYRYLKRHALPYHPLYEQGYLSIGDTHTTKPIHEVDDVEQTRFFGLKRECGLHEMTLS
ncbi:MAG: phosphoadenylyl-sulfate reductase [Gammaproteobacteria bacterium]